MIPFNVPYITGDEMTNINRVFQNKHLAGDGEFTKLCSSWLEDKIATKKVLLTQSCTSALEMAAILSNIQAGDEVIMPSFTFVSTANAFVLRGGIPIFIDIDPKTKNIDSSLIENAITQKTKAIVVVHYAGVSCKMDEIMAIADKYNLIVIEDAAQALLSTYKNKMLGSFGHMACFSFHETKNIQCGEGGALLINDSTLIDRAEIIREKGTNRSQFFRGQVDKYTWYDMGSSFLPSEITAATLYAQLLKSEEITKMKLNIWNNYNDFFNSKNFDLEKPFLPENCKHNGHFYYITFSNLEIRSKIISELKNKNVTTTFHYIPLHSSNAGMKFGKIGSKMDITDKVSNTLLRLPVYPNLDIDFVLEQLNSVLTKVC